MTRNLFPRSFPSSRRLATTVFSILPAIAFSACSQEQTVPTNSPAAAPVSTAPAPLASSHSPSDGGRSFGPIKATVPAGWVEQTPSSQMRKAQYALPKAEGDTEDGELTVFYFGLGQGGSVEANIDRWIGQLSQPDGSSTKDKAKTSKKEVAGLPVTLVDASGTYSAGMMSPGPPRPGYRMVAAVVESSEGPWFFKLVGPEKTIAKWAASFDQFINSFKTS